MKEQVIFAGFGGQGILFVGQVLAYAAMLEGLEVSWMPSYGPEMRGGTATCTVVIASDRIRSPLVDNPTAVIALNQPSLDKFEPRLVPGGALIYNTSMAQRSNARSDVQASGLPADAIAGELQAPKCMNMVTLGRYIALTHAVPAQRIREALESVIPESRKGLRAVNWQAFQMGLSDGV